MRILVPPLSESGIAGLGPISLSARVALHCNCARHQLRRATLPHYSLRSPSVNSGPAPDLAVHVGVANIRGDRATITAHRRTAWPKGPRKDIHMAIKALFSLPAAVLATVALLLVLQPGCGPVLLNQTAERSGSITVRVINTTPYTAAFSYGSWDAWDRSPPGPVQMQQLVLAANSSSAPATVTCARNFSVGTRAFIERAEVVDAPETLPNFNPDAFDSVVHFSNIPPGNPGAALPTVGTALGDARLLGWDYACGDELIFTLVEDPDAEGGFRIDFSVIPESE
jgi:hypothetical protein